MINIEKLLKDCYLQGRWGKGTDSNIGFPLATTLFGKHEPRNHENRAVGKGLYMPGYSPIYHRATMPSDLT